MSFFYEKQVSLTFLHVKYSIMDYICSQNMTIWFLIKSREKVGIKIS
jgi:hypothetical protein